MNKNSNVAAVIRLTTASTKTQRKRLSTSKIFIVEPKNQPVFKEFAKLGSVIAYSVVALPCAKKSSL